MLGVLLVESLYGLNAPRLALRGPMRVRAIGLAESTAPILSRRWMRVVVCFDPVALSRAKAFLLP